MDEKEDPKWRERIDTVVLYDKLEDIRVQLKELERVVRGGRDSLLSEYRRHDQELTRINAVLFQDPTGQRGLLHDVDVLMGRRRQKDEALGFKWQFWGVVLAAAIASAAGILPNLDHIRNFLHHKDPLETKTEKAKRPRVHYHHYTVHVSSDGTTHTTSP